LLLQSGPFIYFYPTRLAGRNAGKDKKTNNINKTLIW